MNANETAAMQMTKKEAKSDRKLFFHNLGELLAQTREGIIGAELSNNELVTVTYSNGYTRRINVDMDIYIAIIRDVTKHL